MCKIREINHDLKKSCQGETTCEWLSVRGYISDMWAWLFFSGIMIDLETDQLSEESKLEESYDKVMKEATTYLNKILDLENTMLEHYKVPTTIIDGKR